MARARSRSLLADLRLGFALGALALGFAVALFADLTFREATRQEDGVVLLSEGRIIARQLNARTASSALPVPESSLIDWSLVASDGKILLGSAGAGFMTRIDWGSIQDQPMEVRPDSEHLYSAATFAIPQGTLRLAMDRTNEVGVLSHFRRDLALAVLLMAVISAGVGHAIAWRGLRSLERIRNETERIEAQDLHRRLDASSFPTELADLVASLNGALQRLESAFSRLEAFSSDLAHELRTPLQNLRAELEGLILRPPPRLDLPDALGSLLEELERLDGMVDQMLFLARSAVPGTTLDLQLLAASGLLREIVAFFTASADEAQVALRIDASPLVLVHADPRLLRRALQNLAANALRHTPPGGSVTFSATAGAGWAEIAVSDSGEGIAPELLPRLGERFLRADAARARATGGAGLGLAIVKGIVELHGGSFAVDSAPGEGTTVRLRFLESAEA